MTMQLSSTCVLSRCTRTSYNSRFDSLPVLHQSTQQTTTKIIIAVVVPIVILLSCSACFFLYWKRKIRKDNRANEKCGDGSIAELSLGEFDTVVAKRRAHQVGTPPRESPEELRDLGNLLGQHVQAPILHELDSGAPSSGISTNTKIDLGRMIANKTINDSSISPQGQEMAMLATDPSRIQSLMTNSAEIKEDSGLSIISEEEDATDSSSTTSWVTAQETSPHKSDYSTPSSSPRRTSPCKRTLRRSTNIIKHYGVVPPERRSSHNPNYWYRPAVPVDTQNTIDARSSILLPPELLSSDRALSRANELRTSRPLSSNPWQSVAWP